MSHTVETLTEDARPIPDPEALAATVQSVGRPPHPWIMLSDEWGNVLRAEGLSGVFRLEARIVNADGVRWVALGPEAGKQTQGSLTLAGRTVKVTPSERLDLETVQAAFAHVVAQGKLPPDLAHRPLAGDHGRMYLMVVGDAEPRPAIGWTDVAWQLSAVPADAPMVAAISEPGRLLIGVFGVGDQVSITVRESRDQHDFERRLGRPQGSSEPVDLQLPQGILTVPKKDLFDREDVLTIVESLYRFDAPPPGFSWARVP